MSTDYKGSYVRVTSGKVSLDADIYIPDGSQGLVAFAHGSGSNRYSPRNRYVAAVMNKAGLGTLLVSLLTAEEEAEDLIKGNLRFDINLLGDRLTGIVDWLHENPQTRPLKIGLFGSSTGAAGALLCAARRPELVHAVVSRGGRPDLASEVLDRILAPTLLIVGGLDHPVIEMNRKALAVLKPEKELFIIPGATHLFEEPGTLEKAAAAARDWFTRFLQDSGSISG